MQILGTSENIRQYLGISKKNANMRYIRIYNQILGVSENNANIRYIEENAIIGYINNKDKYKVHQGLYIILVHHSKYKNMVHYKYIQI